MPAARWPSFSAQPLPCWRARREPWAWPSPPRIWSISGWSSGWASSSARFRCNLGRLWRPLLFLGTTYILIAFGGDFVLGALAQKTQHWLYAAEYVPFAMLSFIAIPLRLAAFLRQRFGLRSATA